MSHQHSCHTISYYIGTPLVTCRILLLTLTGFGLLTIGIPVVFAAPAIEVTVQGIKGDLLANVLASLSIEQEKNNISLTEMEIRRLHEKAPDEIKAALQPFGYYSPLVRSELRQSGGVWKAAYTVSPGEPVTISSLSLVISGEGAQDPVLTTLERNFPVRKGDILQHKRYEDAKQRLQEAALDEGYLDAHFVTHKVEVHIRENTATIAMDIDTGPLYHFGEVIFRQDILKKEFLDRYVPFKKGDPYRTAKLMELQSALYGNDYFSIVEVQPLRAKAENTAVPIEVTLTPIKRRKYSFGAGYGTDTGIRGSVGLEYRWVNRRGHRFNTELRASQIGQDFIVRYIVPMAKPATDHLDYIAQWRSEDIKTFKSSIGLIGPSYTHMRGAWQETVYLNYQRETFNISGERGNSALLLPGATWTRIRTDNRLYPTNGSRLILEAKGADSTFLSDTSFIQLRTSPKFIRRPWENARIILRGDFGVTWVSNFAKLPASQRFFAGGDQSVRGYGYKTLGPVNPSGRIVGGRDLLVGSIEYEQTVYKKLGAAVFYDVGNAINRFSDPLKQGAGFGIRWLSPVGMVRLDSAWALSERGRWRIHFSMGPDL